MNEAGLDSSFARPTPEQAHAAYAAGIRYWGGYLGSREGLGLATLWSREDFAVVQEAGIEALGFCSGWDDPDWIRETAAAWGIIPIADVEPRIREDGDWVDDWLARARAGLYGLASVHFRGGRPLGRGARVNVVADYLAIGCTGETWPSWLPRPPAPCGWQCQGTHDEFDLSVDRGWYDASFGGGEMIDPQKFDQVWLALTATDAAVDDAGQPITDHWATGYTLTHVRACQAMLGKLLGDDDQVVEALRALTSQLQVQQDRVVQLRTELDLVAGEIGKGVQVTADQVLQRLQSALAAAAPATSSPAGA